MKPNVALNLLTLFLAFSAVSPLIGQPKDHPVEIALGIAKERSLREAVSYLDQTVLQDIGKPGFPENRFPYWMVRLTERLYESDQQDLGNECFALAEQALAEAVANPARGQSRPLLKGRLMEARGDIEAAALVYLEAAELRPDDPHLAKALRRAERSVYRRLRSERASGF